MFRFIVSKLRVRHSVRELQTQYENGNKKPLQDLMKAWRGIKNLPPSDPKSFFVLGGYHGEPFGGKGAANPAYWGGYCNHGNVLFPTWHRVYVLKLEQALQSIVPDVMMPYWDETSEETLKLGLPWALTDEEFEGEPNPLVSYTFPNSMSDVPYVGQNDETKPHYENFDYTKPKGYKTVRYPLSGLRGTPKAIERTEKHNNKYPDAEQNTKFLNDNVIAWLEGEPVSRTRKGKKWILKHNSPGIYNRFAKCLDVTDYTIFSNMTSAANWNKDNEEYVVSLEHPHGDIHLAVGGYENYWGTNEGEDGLLLGSNGDMGENNTAGLDPIFFFHHCNIDRMFWLWQKKYGHTDDLGTLHTKYGGVNTSEKGGQGPAEGQTDNELLNMKTKLKPFLKVDNDPQSFYISDDCINIEKKFGFTYSDGSIPKQRSSNQIPNNPSSKKLMVRGIDRSLFSGSFLLGAFAKVERVDQEPEEYYLGNYSVLSRWNVSLCANCQTHLEVIAHFDLSIMPEDDVSSAQFRLEIKHRQTELPKEFKFELSIID